ncbi:hypothetical protein [Nocardioides aurantiacus]|uniref:Uncharacterized protein n=1 Tax=Nocardioides aurantiacus TaxID=86796 RepID=A0A3N2CXA7_9ACTN|nr:hypothetical protein [Nocardioides aurantiacus]ROR92068.1 hypothetical protein EDD33_2952 [Nocardioides aurantiacus]
MARADEPEEPTTTAGLAAVADDLYAGHVEQFVPRRDAAVRAAKQAGEPALARDVGRLRKPSVAAWAVNLLVRVEAEQIDQVLAVAASLRSAAEALDGDELRALTRQRRQLTAALATTARSRARDEGTRLSEAVVEQVEDVLTAAMLDPVAAQVVLTGRLVRSFTSTGVSDLDVASVVAVPDALGVRATPREPEGDADPAPPTLTLVPDDGRARREAEEALEQATEELDAARAEHDEVAASVSRLDARRLQLQGEAEELRRRLAEFEDEVDRCDEEREESQEALDDARAVLDEAVREEERARTALDDLGPA